MAFQGEVWRVGREAPHFDRAIQGARRKSVGVLRIELHHHHIVCMTFKDLIARPCAVRANFVPVPQLDL